MLFGKDSFSKKNNGKYIIGYELSSDFVQISYLRIGDKEPQTLSLVAGMEQYNIPQLLYKREENNLWYIGKEAANARKEYGGPILSDLLGLAYKGDMVDVYLETYDPCALLALFVKRSLSYLSMTAPLEQIAAIMFTVEGLNDRMVAVLRQMVEYLQLPRVQVQFIGKEESFFYYNLHTEPELWSHPVMLYEMQRNILQSYRLFLNRQTTPTVTLVEHKEYPHFEGDIPQTEEEKALWDQIFLEYLQEDMEGKVISTVYLIGDGFLGEWYPSSVRYLCAKRRVFRGNNLYSKGACYALWNMLEPGELNKNYVYLGNDKLMANIGMELLQYGELSYLAILDGGNSWYDCRKEWDMILEKDNQLQFRITPLNGKNMIETQIVLHGLKVSKQPFCRIHVEVYMETPKEMKVKVWDKGFGEFYPSSGKYWEENIEL